MIKIIIWFCKEVGIVDDPPGGVRYVEFKILRRIALFSLLGWIRKFS